MRYVFATFCSGFGARNMKEFHDQCSRIPVDSLLISILHGNEVKRAIDYARRCPKKADLWVDSGAFTIWQQGGHISAKWLVKQLRSLMPYLKDFRNVFPVALDVIPGARGQKPSQKQINSAVKESVKNAEYMIAEGMNVVPVHHQGDPLEVFSQYQEIAEYVGISPANDQSIPSRVEYVKSLLPLIDLKNPIPCHSFGNVSPKVVQAFPFYSADAASWKQSIYYGQDFSLTHTKRYVRQTGFYKLKGRFQKVSVSFESVRKCLDYQKQNDNFWSYRNVYACEPQTFKRTL